MHSRRNFLRGTLAVAATAAAARNTDLDFAAIEAEANAELQSTHTPGVAIGIVKSGRLIYAQGFGTRNIETGEPITAKTLFRLGSTTKMLTATTVASLAEGGKLEFQDAVGKHVPRLNNAIAPLTINQVLSHTSGLKDEAVMNGRHDDHALGEEILQWDRDWLFTTPGRIFSYSNPGFWLAGRVAESVAGAPYADVMEKHVFTPLNMSWTTLRPTMAMTRELAQGHDFANGQISVVRPAADNAANWPAGSVFSNLNDLTRFVVALMNGGVIDGAQIVSPHVVTALTTPHAAIPGGATKYGYGLDLDGSGATLSWSHGGSRAGYGSFITMFPARQEAVLVLCNRSGESLARTRNKISQSLGMPVAPTNHDPGSIIEPASFGHYIGRYGNGGQTLEIKNVSGRLCLQDTELRRTADGWLVGQDSRGEVRIFCVRDASGQTEYVFRGGRSFARA